MKKRPVSTVLAAFCVLSLFSSALAAEPSLAHADMGGSLRIYIEGTEAALLDSSNGIREPLLYEDTVYIPLWTVGIWAGADVRWDQASMTVTINHAGVAPVYPDISDLNNMNAERREGAEQYQADLKNGVEVQLLPAAAVQVDGTARQLSAALGQTTCPLLFRDQVYLPAPYVAELLGKQMLRFSGNIYFYETPTQEELLEAGNYLSDVRNRVSSARAVVKGEPPQTVEEYTDKVKAVQTDIKAVTEFPAPAFKGLMCFVEQIKSYSLLVLSECVDPYLPVEESSGAAEVLGLSPRRPVDWSPVEREDGTTVFRPVTSQEPPVDPQKSWDSFSDYMITLAEGKPGYTTYFLSLEDICASGEEFLTTVRAALPDDAFAADPAAYTDGDRIVYREAVDTLSQLGVISGKEDGSFDPQGLITRAECAKLFCLMECGGDMTQLPGPAQDLPFSDIEGHWAENYISDCAWRGVLNGRGEGIFDPDANVTGLEFTKMALGSLGYNPAFYGLTGPDWKSMTNRLALLTCSPSLYEGLDENAKMSGPVTREVAAQILYNILYNGILEAVPHVDPATGMCEFTYSPWMDENGQAILFYTIYFDAEKWDILSAG